MEKNGQKRIEKQREVMEIKIIIDSNLHTNVDRLPTEVER